MTNIDLKSMEIDELKLYAQESDIKIHHKLKDKDKIIDMINKSQEINSEVVKIKQVEEPEIVSNNIDVEEKELKNEKIEESEEYKKTDREILKEYDEKIMKLNKELNDTKKEREIYYEKVSNKVKPPTLQELIEISRSEGIGNKNKELQQKKELLLKAKRRQENVNVITQNG